MEIQKSKYKM